MIAFDWLTTLLRQSFAGSSGKTAGRGPRMLMVTRHSQGSAMEKQNKTVESAIESAIAEERGSLHAITM